MNKCLLLPLVILKLKTVSAIKLSLAFFGLGVGVGYLINSSHEKRQPKEGMLIDKIEPKSNAPVPSGKSANK